MVTQRIIKIGTSHGIILDAATLEIARLKVADRVSITVNKDGSIILTPLRPIRKAEKAASMAKRLIQKNSELFKRLSL